MKEIAMVIRFYAIMDKTARMSGRRKGGGWMSTEAYELLSLGARYWFAFLGIIIVWRSFSWLRKDGRLRRKRLRQLPDAGMIGELVVLAGSDEMPAGTIISLPREGTMGSLRICDVCLPCPGVAGKHLTFQFRDGIGLLISPWPQQEITIDGEDVVRKGDGEYMYHGSRLIVGDAVLRMRLFMGLSTQRTPAFQEDIEPVEQVPQPQYAQVQPTPQDSGGAWDWRENSIIYHQAVQDWREEYTEEDAPYDESFYQGNVYQQPYYPQEGDYVTSDEQQPLADDQWDHAQPTDNTKRGLFRRKRR